MTGTRTGKTHITLALAEAARKSGVPVVVLDSNRANGQNGKL